MPSLVWDKVGTRKFESGLDRGVLYLPDGSAVPWNGLTSVIENFDRKLEPVYFDGVKVSDIILFGSFEATMKAVTYPDEFTELEGSSELKQGFFLSDQQPKAFGLCYRVMVGDDLHEVASDYKLHIIYNVTAIPSDKTYASLSTDPNLVEFEWELSAIPEEVPGFRPTAHVTIDSRSIDPYLLEDIEKMLYGGTLSDAALVPMQELAEYIRDWFRIRIFDNGDGTWTAISDRDEFIDIDLGTGYFEILGVNAVYLNDYTYEVSDTIDISQVPQIKIIDHDNGTWTAQTTHPSLIVEIEEGLVEIRNANVEYLNSTTYLMSDTVERD